MGSEVKASACNAGDLGSIPGSGRSPGEGSMCAEKYTMFMDWKNQYSENEYTTQSNL